MTSVAAESRPDVWEARGEVDDLAVHDLAHPHLTDGLWRELLSKRLLGRSDLGQCHVPPTAKTWCFRTRWDGSGVAPAFGSPSGAPGGRMTQACSALRKSPPG